MIIRIGDQMEWNSGSTPTMQTLLALIEQYHIRKNAAPEGIFSYFFGIISIYCTQADHPGGLWMQYQWGRSPLGSFTKDAEGLGNAHFLFSQTEQEIIGFTFSSSALALSSQRLLPRDAITNRPEDLAWVAQKLTWLWRQAFPDGPPPHLLLEPDTAAVDSEATVDFIHYHATGPGRLTAQVEQAVRDCGPGWHRLEQIARHLPSGSCTDDHRSALWSLVQDGQLLARPNHDWPQWGTGQEFHLPDGQ